MRAGVTSGEAVSLRSAVEKRRRPDIYERIGGGAGTEE
ncbi:hypothetical protein BH18ACT11_BH18ACT11_07750 [soil metagenome]